MKRSWHILSNRVVVTCIFFFFNADRKNRRRVETFPSMIYVGWKKAVPQVIVAEPTKLMVFILRSRKTTRAFPFNIQATILQRYFNIFKQEDTRKKCLLFFARSHKFYTLLHAVQFILRFTLLFFKLLYSLRKVFSYTIRHAMYTSIKQLHRRLWCRLLPPL